MLTLSRARWSQSIQFHDEDLQNFSSLAHKLNDVSMMISTKEDVNQLGVDLKFQHDAQTQLLKQMSLDARGSFDGLDRKLAYTSNCMSTKDDVRGVSTQLSLQRCAQENSSRQLSNDSQRNHLKLEQRLDAQDDALKDLLSILASQAAAIQGLHRPAVVHSASVIATRHSRGGMGHLLNNSIPSWIECLLLSFSSPSHQCFAVGRYLHTQVLRTRHNPTVLGLLGCLLLALANALLQVQLQITLMADDSIVLETALGERLRVSSLYWTQSEILHGYLLAHFRYTHGYRYVKAERYDLITPSGRQADLSPRLWTSTTGTSKTVVMRIALQKPGMRCSCGGLFLPPQPWSCWARNTSRHARNCSLCIPSSANKGYKWYDFCPPCDVLR